MVDLDTFLTAVYVIVDDIVSALPQPPLVGRPTALSPSEVVTLALVAQWQHFGGERAFYRYAEAHLRPLFPRLPHRSQYNRCLRRCHDLLVAVAQQVARRLDAFAGQGAYEVLDSTGVRTRNSKRRGRGWLAGRAATGWCTRLGFFHGFTLLTAVTPLGAITGYGLCLPTTSDQARADTFLAARQQPHPALPEVGSAVGTVYLADSGFTGRAWWQRWMAAYGVSVITPPLGHETGRRWPAALRRAHAGWRQIVETVHERLLDTFGLEDERPHALQGLRARLAAKVALHNLCLWLNVQGDRPPLAFAELIEW
jgi:hypothetical protein